MDSDDEGNTSTTNTSAAVAIWTVVELDGEEIMVEWTSETNFVDTEDSHNNYSSKNTRM